MSGGSLGYDGQLSCLPANVAGRKSFLEKLEPEYVNYKTGVTSYSCKNLTVNVRGDRVTVKGSPATFLHGENPRSLDWKQMRLALEAMSDEMKVDFFRADLWRIEFAGTFVVEDPPVTYRSFLHLPRKGRKEVAQSLYLQNERRTFVFDAYDKGENRLRLEVRRRLLAHFLGSDFHVRGKPVRVQELCKEEVFNRFAQDWQTQTGNALAQTVYFPELPQQLSAKVLAEIESRLCRENPATFSQLQSIVECLDSAGRINKNLRAPLLRELHSPCSEVQNGKVEELRLKIKALLDTYGIESDGLIESKPSNHSSKQGIHLITTRHR